MIHSSSGESVQGTAWPEKTETPADTNLAASYLAANRALVDDDGHQGPAIADQLNSLLSDPKYSQLNTRHARQYARLIVWFRRDLRLQDNPALLAASMLAEEVIPVYIYAPEEDGQFQPGRCSRWWLERALGSLQTDIRAAGSDLFFFRSAESSPLLLGLVDDLQADGVFFNHLYDPISMVRDNEVKTQLRRHGVVCQSFNCDTLREPWSVVRVEEGGEAPYSTFESFWEAWGDVERLGAVGKPAPGVDLAGGVLGNGNEGGGGGGGAASRVPAMMSTYVRGCYREVLEDVGVLSRQEAASNAQLEVHWKPGREGGIAVLGGFVEDKLRLFSNDKAKTDRKSTSKLSPYLHYGEIGVREVYEVVTRWESSLSSVSSDPERPQRRSSSAEDDRARHAEAFRKQLGYREYSRYLSFHFPFTHERAMLEHLRAVPWRYDQRLFKAWRTGNTGYPIVDAAMRELWSTGWMHNRCRVVCASFLVKYLMLPWQWGLKHFWDALLDADLECDTLGWQYCAGCLTDGHEFSMVMDLEEEVQKYDPKGMYVRRWVPALARLPMAYVHCPWKAPADVLEDAGIELGDDYPWPVVEFEAAKETVSRVAEFVGCAGGGGGGEKEAAAAAVKSPYRPATTPLSNATSIEDILGGASTDSVVRREGSQSLSVASAMVGRGEGADGAASARRAQRKRSKV